MDGQPLATTCRVPRAVRPRAPCCFSRMRVLVSKPREAAARLRPASTALLQAIAAVEPGWSTSTAMLRGGSAVGVTEESTGTLTPRGR